MKLQQLARRLIHILLIFFQVYNKIANNTKPKNCSYNLKENQFTLDLLIKRVSYEFCM